MTAEPVFLGLGSNLEDREAHLTHALRDLRELGAIRGVSGVYETPPEGYPDQPPFLNVVVHLETPLEPNELLECTRQIERDRGRVRTFRNAPRTLDIDVLLYGERVLDLEGLTVPHPRMTARAFVLVPLLELAPERGDPRTGRPYRKHLVDLLRARGDADIGDAGVVGDVRHLAGLGVRRVMAGEELLDDEID